MSKRTNAFGQRLRRDRSAAGLSIRQLAQIASIDFSYVSKIETGAGITQLSLAERRKGGRVRRRKPEKGSE